MIQHKIDTLQTFTATNSEQKMNKQFLELFQGRGVFRSLPNIF